MNKRKSILITGATSGIGYELTKRLLAEGHSVWATGRAPDTLTGLQNMVHRQSGGFIQRGGLGSVDGARGSTDVVIFSAGIGTSTMRMKLLMKRYIIRWMLTSLRQCG